MLRRAASYLTPYVVKLYTFDKKAHANRPTHLKLGSTLNPAGRPFPDASHSKFFKLSLPIGRATTKVSRRQVRLLRCRTTLGLSMCVVRQMEVSTTFTGWLAIPGVGRMGGLFRRWEDRTYQFNSEDVLPLVRLLFCFVIIHSTAVL